MNNKDCGFFKKELFDYFSDKPEMIEKYTNLFFEINSGVKMNTDVAFRNHEQDLNILNINLNNIYINHDHDNYKNNIFFSQHLKKYFNANYDKMPKMDKEYLSLCDVSFYESLSNDQDQEMKLVETSIKNLTIGRGRGGSSRGEKFIYTYTVFHWFFF